MSHRGFSHIGLSTLDLDKTREFYEGVLGFKPVIADTIKIKEGGRIRHIFFDAGRDQLIAFMEPHGVSGVPIEYDAGINRGLGVPASFYHVAFEAGSEAALPTSATSFAPKESRSRTSSTTRLQSRSILKTPTACLSSTAASCVISPKTMRRCRSDSQCHARRWNSVARPK
jgi:catechol 2,3-dioxygenase-like lactoylglutathione lyase family enzyme